jgi:biopolymer transport protein ExbD
VDRQQLFDKLSAIAKQFKNQPVRIRGDGGVAYQRIVEVIDTCQKSGISNISFATQRPEPAK